MLISNGTGLQFAPQALAEYSPIPSGTGYFYAKQGVELLNRFTLYGQLYERQPWVFAVVSKLAKSAARLKINVWDMTDTAAKTLDASSPYARFLRRPNPTMTRFQLVYWTWATRKIFGEAFWYKMRNADGSVGAVYPMHPSRTQIRRNGDTGEIEYVFALGVASAGILTASADDVVPFQNYHPNGLMRGLSPLEALRTTLYNEDAARRAMESWWKKGARPSVVFSAPQTLSEEAYQRLKGQLDSRHAGADQMGSTLLLEEGVKPQAMQLSAEEMQYIQSRTMNREEVCGVYDVPPPVMQILDHATFSNITEQMRSMYRDTMAPDLEEFEAVLDHFLRPDFDPLGDSVARFALDDVLRGDFETRAAAIAPLVQSGVYMPGEARPLFDLPDAGPVSHRLYANAAIQPLGSPAVRETIAIGSAMDPEPPNPAEQEDENAAIAERAGMQPASQPSPSKRATRERNARRARLRQTDQGEES